jgi:diguanylate cyclase (GGDEF)-like protein/PAS domain S-box-containing protein
MFQSTIDDYLKTLFNAIPDLVFLKDERGRMLLINESALRFFGLENMPYQGKTDREIANYTDFYRDAFLYCEITDEETWQCAKTTHCLEIIPRPDGTRRIFDVIKNPLFHADGSRRGLINIGRDVTEHKEREEQISQILSGLDLVIWSCNPINNQLLYCSEGSKRVYGYSPEEFMAFPNQLDWEKLIHPDDLPKLKTAREELLCGKSITNVFRAIHRSGELRWIREEIHPVVNTHGELIRLDGIATDITEKVISHQKIKHMAYHDDLTGLPNRRFLLERLEVEWEKAQRDQSELAVLFIDMDRLKFINDTLGHEAGDLLIHEVANRLKKIVPTNAIVCRQSGDEFIILIPQVDQIDLEKTAKTIRDSLAYPYFFGDQECFLSGSIGISLSRDGSLRDLIPHADVAMYQAKKSGGNAYLFFRPELEKKLHRKVSLEKALRKALEKQEFSLHYQPRFDLHSKGIKSVEALIRWTHPKWGNIPPSEFIGLAEENGLIIPIGEWVLRKACQQQKAWEAEGAPLGISVNLSLRQFYQEDIVQVVAQIIKDTGIYPHCLQLEITETTIMGDIETALSILNGLKGLGIQISIDDFGTGFSSLNHLRRFPVDELKIDRSFISDIHSDPKCASVIKAIINLSKCLGLKIVAEGVETKEQYHFLKNNECDEIQGYYISHPLPPKELIKKV